MKFHSFLSKMKRFGANREGGVAIIFALAFTPMLLMIASAVDYTRLNAERQRLQSAMDSTLIHLAQDAPNATQAQLQAKANILFASTFRTTATQATITVTKVGEQLSGKATYDVPLAFGAIIRQPSYPVGAVSVVEYKSKKIELALVLDNTGSMAQNGKMPALKASVNDLIDQLKLTVKNPGDVKLSIVPFNTQVKIDTSWRNAAWLRWDVTLENPNFGWMGLNAAPPAQLTWAGCLADRNQSYDSSSEPSNGGNSRYVAANCHFGPLAAMMPLTTDLDAVRSVANAMQPTGATNVTIGLATGLATLRNDHPLGSASSNNPDVEKFIIVLTDGNNTQNRFGGNGQDGNGYAVSIDNRLRDACNAAKLTKVRVFTIRVMDGNASLLSDCATKPSMYYDVQNASQMQPVFRAILDAIKGVRLSS